MGSIIIGIFPLLVVVRAVSSAYRLISACQSYREMFFFAKHQASGFLRTIVPDPMDNPWVLPWVYIPLPVAVIMMMMMMMMMLSKGKAFLLLSVAVLLIMGHLDKPICTADHSRFPVETAALGRVAAVDEILSRSGSSRTFSGDWRHSDWTTGAKTSGPVVQS